MVVGKGLAVKSLSSMAWLGPARASAMEAVILGATIEDTTPGLSSAEGG